MKKHALTDLEYAVLGAIALNEPVTAYAVRAVFARSLSAHWSSSAGSIYPAIRRLTDRGLIRVTRRESDGRGTQANRLTAKGRDTLTSWLTPPLPDGSALMPIDPLRMRLRFLALLQRADAVAALRNARKNLQTQLARIQTQFRTERTQDPMQRATHRGALLAVRAQVKWVEELIADADTLFDP